MLFASQVWLIAMKPHRVLLYVSWRKKQDTKGTSLNVLQVVSAFGLLCLKRRKFILSYITLKARGEGDNRGRDGCAVSPKLLTWIWPNSGRQWKTGGPGVLWSMGLWRVRYDLMTKQQQQHYFETLKAIQIFYLQMSKKPRQRVLSDLLESVPAVLHDLSCTFRRRQTWAKPSIKGHTALLYRDITTLVICSNFCTRNRLYTKSGSSL